ncbi:hypothetical protein [Hoeflea sp.]|uniref:hypothetical protein n=1 Tax=Hoeflea sp. TaxID=1940281 RepID=UPI003B01C861
MAFVRAIEADGDYDAYERRITVPPPGRLTEMNVGAVLAWQHQVRAAGDPSTAAGACRIIHATLQGLVGRLRIDPAARFTPALQDRLARALIGECGRKGPPERHARYGNCLARIWAGLPLTAGPRRGRSDHSHVAGNRALTDPDTVLALLRGEAVPLKGHLQRNGPARNAGRAFNVRTPGATPAGSRSRSADSIPGRFGDMMAAGDPAGASPAPSRVPAPARDIVRVRARNEAKPLAAPMAGTPTVGAWSAGIAAFAPGLMAGRLSAAGPTAAIAAAIATALGLTAAGRRVAHDCRAANAQRSGPGAARGDRLGPDTLCAVRTPWHCLRRSGLPEGPVRGARVPAHAMAAAAAADAPLRQADGSRARGSAQCRFRPGTAGAHSPSARGRGRAVDRAHVDILNWFLGHPDGRYEICDLKRRRRGHGGLEWRLAHARMPDPERALRPAARPAHANDWEMADVGPIPPEPPPQLVFEHVPATRAPDDDEDTGAFLRWIRERTLEDRLVNAMLKR